MGEICECANSGRTSVMLRERGKGPPTNISWRTLQRGKEATLSLKLHHEQRNILQQPIL